MIVAYDTNHAIGYKNSMPWGHSLPADLKNFQKMTLNNTVLMGSNTYQSIGKALPNRKNMVLSRDTSLVLPDAEVFNSLDEIKKSDIIGQLFVIGGAQIYELAFQRVDTVYATEVLFQFESDTKLNTTQFLEEGWIEKSREHHVADKENSYDFDFVEYVVER